jgi:hypothetical protein
MLFVAMGKVKTGSSQERIARRAQWQYPEGMQVVTEYWPVGGEYSVITVAEADNIAPITAAITAWEDVLDITVTPPLTVEEGLRLAET